MFQFLRENDTPTTTNQIFETSFEHKWILKLFLKLNQRIAVKKLKLNIKNYYDPAG